MVSLVFIFWMYVFLFAVIGGIRGWAKEILVSFSVILALTFTELIFRYVEALKSLPADSDIVFWLDTAIIVLLVFFGYQTPNIQRFAAKMTREKFQDVILGAVIGALNGYLIAGTIWVYLDHAGYPFAKVMQAPTGAAATVVKNMLIYMAPNLLQPPTIYFAVVIAFVFVIVVFV